MKLLLIEDDEALHTALTRSLTRLGWQVEVCQDESCVSLMRNFIASQPQLWNEDIGE